MEVKDISFELGELLVTSNSGASLHLLKNQPDKVIKFAWHKAEWQTKRTCEIISGLVGKYFKHVVHIYAFGMVSPSVTYTVMDRLYVLESDEIIILDQFIRYAASLQFSRQEIQKQASAIQPKALGAMCRSIRELRKYSNDIHSGNIMKDKAGNYFIVDLESAS